MAEVVLLGTARALPTVGQENTYLALVGVKHIVLVDCAGSPYRRLLEARLAPGLLDTVILTHGHPDHIYGLPALCMSLWLAGRRAPLDIYGPAETCDLAQALLRSYHPEAWPGMFEVRYHAVVLTNGAAVCLSEDFVISAAPVEHTLPAIGIRVVERKTGRILAYSGDTGPSSGVRFLARQAHLLIHEATGAYSGHSTAAQAGSTAQSAGARRLVLVHYDAGETPPAAIVSAAQAAFDGPVYAGHDLDRMTW